MEDERSEAEEQLESISIGVTTTDGDRTSHTYFLSTSDVVDRLSEVEAIARLLWMALSRSNEVITFYNPFVMYRSDHITSIEVSSPDLMEEVEKVRRDSI